MMVVSSLTVESPAAFVAALGRAHEIALTAYTLPDGTVRAALEAAARRGATVRVRLERDPLDDAAGTLHRANQAAVRALDAAGASAGLTRAGEPALHLKAAAVDGVAWLDDRNWAMDGPQRILRDAAPADVAAVRAAVAGGRGDSAALATTKAAALRGEAALVARAGREPLAVESESFGNGPVLRALARRARAGRPTRLIVAGREVAGSPRGREGRQLARLAALGVAVRVGDPRAGDLDEKLAVGGGAGWAGSANATTARGAYGAQRDWGLVTHDPAVVDQLRRSFERNWAAARPLADVAAAAVVQ